ncbi:MAG: 3-isopropylmalate dehydratase large subunit [Clostridiales bacterium]|jgi:3-isopropylmalate/(R)-2-methylmalate dehydratase large subunit|nr:3-isopropylmalate dehydratase large subunit [Clostridiales bacterium]
MTELTLTQKILAAHSGLNEVKPGQLIEANIDLALGNDVTAPVAIKEFDKLSMKVFDRSKIALVPDHFTPNKDIKSAENCAGMRRFASEHNIEHYFEIGEMGIEHCLLPERGLTAPGELIIGADSHTCTYGAVGAVATGVGSTDLACVMATGKLWFKVPAAVKFTLKGKPAPYVGGKDIILHIIGKIGVDGALYQSMEFAGDGIKYLSIDDRFTISNMAIEAGGKNGIFPVDDVTMDYLKRRVEREYKIYEPDSDAQYSAEYEIDLSALLPTVAFPHLPSNTKTVDEAGEIRIDQVVIGSCTNGRISDLRIAAEILKDKHIAKGIRLIILPGTQEIYLDALREGLVEIFVKAGAAFSTPTCGPCLGGHMGILAKGERALSTTNRNFVGRMGHPESEVYLCGPAVAAASALTGRITNPAGLESCI